MLQARSARQPEMCSTSFDPSGGGSSCTSVGEASLMAQPQSSWQQQNTGSYLPAVVDNHGRCTDCIHSNCQLLQTWDQTCCWLTSTCHATYEL